MNDTLLHHLRLLKLGGIREHLEARLMEANANNLSHEEFLAMLLSDELDIRTTHRVNRLLAKASLGVQSTIEGFEFNFNPEINAKQVKSLATCRFVERGEGVIFLGPTGTGKTHLTKALCTQACRLQFSVAYAKCKKLIEEMATADLQNRLPVLMKRLLKVDLLAIDDIGLNPIDQASAERLYTIVDARFHLKSIILTSNRAITDWPGLFPDPVMANAILDRLAHTSHHVILKGQSYRKKLQPKTEEE